MWSAAFSPTVRGDAAYLEASDPPPTLEDARALLRDRFLGMDGPLVYLLARSVWPRAPQDRFRYSYPITSIPILMMHGTRDGNTPLSGALEVSAALGGVGQQLVTFPGGGHSLFNRTRSADQLDCAAHLVTQFVQSPGSPVNADCADRLVPPSFEVIDAASAIFGTEDAWGD